MWWYIFMDILFSLYLIDLMVHFTAAMVAKLYWYIWPQITTKACNAARKQQKQQQRRGTPIATKQASGGRCAAPSSRAFRLVTVFYLSATL